MGAKVIFNHADFRLMSKRALEAFSMYKETNIFLRGMVPLVGYKSDVVKYERAERLAGESKYPLKKMLALAYPTDTNDYLAWRHNICNQPCHYNLLTCKILHWSYRKRMGKYSLLHLGIRRSSASCNRCNRRIYRKNIS